MKKSFYAILLGIFLIFGLVACKNQEKESSNLQETEITGTGLQGESKETPTEAISSDNQAKEIHVGVQATDYIQFLEAGLGYFQEEFSGDGITVIFDTFASGPAITEALASDNVDIGFLGDLPALTAASAGIEFHIIGRGAGTTNGIAVVLPTGSDITDIAQLKGKKVAFTVGTAGHEFIIKALETAGLTEADIQPVNVANPDIEATLISGSVDAVVTVGPFINKIETNGEGTVLVSNEDIYQPVPAIIAADSFLEENPELVTRFLKTWIKTSDYATNNLEEAYDLLSEQQDMDRAYYDRFQLLFRVTLDDNDYEVLKETKAFLLNQELIVKDFDLNSYLDTSFLEKAASAE
jgi:aliphatic sulfonates family ABC transporter substrate-binding protein